ncbi:hypothetical protein GGH94_001142 [Coemansia aciculifera]|uniref:Uncharacterized protein n=2 Tax=Coemansia TaxID=4863 RepID=A0A9W8GRY5_9FUNG|nr:hypothetical protein GGI19_005636 [Coemansia pectinata]KAJ2866975.1 hypothetical protein GGH94_001142 [Coemansia aciculifera]KAJ2876097.1 hypothetical protein GGH93_001021 [Coemansia aciculifera]KAJ2884877.1 hypothetical protein H4R27_001782 [Coemansia aciculifera]
MKTGAVTTSIWLLAVAVALAETGGDSGAVAGGRHVKIGRIPRGLEHYAKRDGEESSSGSAKTTPTPTPSKSDNGNNNNSSSGGSTSAKPTSQSTSAKPTNNGSSKGSSSGTEQGPLDTDKEHSSSPTHTNTSGSNNGGGSSSKGGQSGDTDAEGNPILTNEHASYWNMITPTGVSYLSGGWRVVPGAAMVAAAVVVGAFI